MGKVMGNRVMVKLDPENDRVSTPTGFEILIDNTFEPEKHITVTGTVMKIPGELKFSPRDNGQMPWETEIELREGDGVVMYYLAVQNCLKKEYAKAIIVGKERYIFIDYSNIYAAVREGKVTPINGHVLIEPMESPWLTKKREHLKVKNLHMVILETQTKKDVVFGKVAYAGKPNKRYYQPGISDEGIDVAPGDKVVLKKVRDIPMEYEYHTKVDGGRKLYRVQRHDILAKF